MNILMALFDYGPVIFFMIASIKLQRLLYNYMSKGSYALLCSGTISIIAAGLFKATWKLLYNANICDFEKLNQCFFPMQSLGFLLAGIAMLSLIRKPLKKTNLYAVPVFSGTWIFVTGMVLGVMAVNLSLAKIALDHKKKTTAILYIIAFLLMLCMGYLSSKDFTQTYMNWIAQAINFIGQGLFLKATMDLEKTL